MEGAIRILHLEDDPDDAVLVRATLEAAGLPCEITPADSQEEYLKALGSRPFDLIISDFTLPSFDGFSALALAKKRCPQTPVLFFSGTLRDEDARMCLGLGAAGYVLKQAGLQALVPAVRKALGSRLPPKAG